MPTATLNETEKCFLAKAEQYCAQNEQCRHGVTEKLRAWGADKELTEKIVEILTEEGFIDEERYCRLYCDSKLRLNKWGRIKIAYQLRAKQIDNETIEDALHQIDESEYRNILEQLAKSKLKTIHDDDPRRKEAKLMTFLASHGFEKNEIYQVTKNLK
ncbi:MAG: RecX family transcriptional regulator [Bacteroidales bacterium]|nr:RecX family transcriptional regulator [Bacteroidales bacterium]